LRSGLVQAEAPQSRRMGVQGVERKPLNKEAKDDLDSLDCNS